jgi:hypothetical protein
MVYPEVPVRVALIHTAENESVFDQFRSSFPSFDLSWSLLKPGDGWWDPMALLVEQTDLVVFAPVEPGMREDALAYALGFVQAKRMPAIVLDHDGHFPYIPAQFALPATRSPQVLGSFISSEYRKWSSRQRRIRAAARLHRKGWDVGLSSFEAAVKSGELGIIDLFIAAGFDPDHVGKDGIPVISHAVRAGKSPAVRFLLNAGADPNRVAKDRGHTPLMDAAGEGDALTTEELIVHGADLDVKSKSGQTALILAIGKGDVTVAQMLILAGADLEASDALGMTAAKYAKLFRKDHLLNLIEARSAAS